jgi:hypothetical protein
MQAGFDDGEHLNDSPGRHQRSKSRLMALKSLVSELVLL